MHTKGPWIKDGIMVVSPEGEDIALISYKHTKEEFNANASLIAAATELLEALDGFTQFIELMGMKVPRDVKHIIAKAKGENDE